MDITLIIIGLFSVAAGWKFKTRKDAGWVGFGYISLVVFVISIFAVMLTSVLFSEVASIVSSTLYEGGLDAVELSGEMVIMGFGIFIMWLVLFLAFIGIVLYVFGLEMDKFFKLIRNLGSYFFIPLLMIGFEALLIYALLYGNDIPTFATVILVFFIIVLGLSIWAYFKMIFFSKGKLKWQRTGAGSWGADWVVDDEEDLKDEVVENAQTSKEKQKKEMVPLNEEYLRKIDNYRKK